MLSEADNVLLTRTGPKMPMGDLFRRFWHLVLLSAELPEPDGPPLRIAGCAQAVPSRQPASHWRG